ncbi:MAG: lipoprotein-releasing system ATP-binding protein LolD 1 [Planctomycetaceae bacterium]|nr:MAG: lipoprotein-releasing system ATP-binding protein LolD 1 [Planctomycetaceae bacterium]
MAGNAGSAHSSYYPPSTDLGTKVCTRGKEVIGRPESMAVATAIPPMLSVQHLVKEYPTPQGPLRILDDLELQLLAGEAVAIVGPSGSGKSTLLYILGVLESPTAGTVRLKECQPHRLSPAQQAAFRNQEIGFVFQDHHLLPQCTVLENVLLPMLPRGVTAEVEAYARHLLERVGLSRRLEHRPAQLSGGERQRAAVCRALVNRPALLLADEPTGSLDPATARQVGQLLLELQREAHTLLVCVTHSVELAAKFPRQLELREGRLREIRLG